MSVDAAPLFLASGATGLEVLSNEPGPGSTPSFSLAGWWAVQQSGGCNRGERSRPVVELVEAANTIHASTGRPVASSATGRPP
jgi:hypothetical protein